MAMDETKVFYPENGGLTRRGAIIQVFLLTKDKKIPNFGQVSLGMDKVMEGMTDELMQDFANHFGELHMSQADYAMDDWLQMYHYRVAKFTEALVHQVHVQMST